MTGDDPKRKVPIQMTKDLNGIRAFSFVFKEEKNREMGINSGLGRNSVMRIKEHFCLVMLQLSVTM